MAVNLCGCFVGLCGDVVIVTINLCRHFTRFSTYRVTDASVPLIFIMQSIERAMSVISMTNLRCKQIAGWDTGTDIFYFHLSDYSSLFCLLQTNFHLLTI